MPAAPKHRKPIIDAAVTLFRRQGYAQTGLNDIIDASGAPKGSLYHYFPDGKTAIAAAAVAEAGERVAATVEQLARESRSCGELLRANARLLASWMRKSGFRDGCPITTVLLELAPRERSVTAAGRRAYTARLAVFTKRLVDDGWPQRRAERLAVLCVSALQGALIQARVERSERPLLSATEELVGLIERTKA